MKRKDNIKLNIAKEESVIQYSKFIANPENFRLLPANRTANYRKILYGLINEILGYSVEAVTWKNRYNYPTGWICLNDIPVLIPLMEACLLRVLTIFLNDIQEEKNRFAEKETDVLCALESETKDDNLQSKTIYRENIKGQIQSREM